ncbi:MAG: hypothetical protein ACK50P_03705 [Planctomycetaceae bacterium]|jgi:hypothetical protein
MLDSVELQEQARRLAETHGFRWLPSYKCHQGLHRGVIFRIRVWDGRIEVLCGSPFVVLVDQILNDFADAGSLNAAGIPQSWLSGAMSDKQPAGGQDLGGLVLTLDAERFETLGETGFRQILDLLADQFHEWGAPEELICESCQSQAANSVGLINNISTPLCAECWSEFQSRWPEGRVALSPPPGPVAKHIWWILGGLAVICVLLIFAVQIFLLFI